MDAKEREHASIVVFASGTGSNFEALARAFPHHIRALICNEKNASVIEKSKASSIPCHLIEHRKYASRTEHEKKILHTLSELEPIHLIVLAGYMRVLTPSFFAVLQEKKIDIINLHPAHLDEYKGPCGYEAAIARKAVRWGLSVHRVVAELDSGTLLNCADVPVYPFDSESSLKNRARSIEHRLLLETVQEFITGKKSYVTNVNL